MDELSAASDGRPRSPGRPDHRGPRRFAAIAGVILAALAGYVSYRTVVGGRHDRAGTRGAPAARRGTTPSTSRNGPTVPAGTYRDPIPLSVDDCLGRPESHITALKGTISGQYRNDRPGDNHTFDARAATFTGDGTSVEGNTPMIYPLLIGKAKPSRGVCVLGGSVPGRMDRTMTWEQLKAHQRQADGQLGYYDAAALTVFALGNDGHLVDGLRVDNVSDGVAARGSYSAYQTVPLDGGNFYLRDVYFTYVHDDCIDLNDLISGVAFDSLFDGCYTGISERPDDGSPLFNYPAPPEQTFTLDHILMHMTPFPGPHATDDCPAGTADGYNEIFKWSDVANQPVVKNSIFLLDTAPCSTRYFPFPPNAILDNVTIVWAGQGPWRWPTPPGTSITTDHSVWDRARAQWLERHGCTSTAAGVAATANDCSRLTSPARFR